MSAEMTRQELLAEVARLTKENEELRNLLQRWIDYGNGVLKAQNTEPFERQLAEAKKDAERIRSLIVQIGIVGQIDGHDVIRRESAIELIDRVIAMREGE